jgi:hypothetical protein
MLFVLVFSKYVAADLILTYDLQSVGGTVIQVAPHSSTSSAVSGQNLVRGAGLIASTGGLNGANSFAAAGWDSLSSNDYVSFGFQVTPGFQVTVNSVQFRVASQTGGPANLGLFTSQDNFSTAVSTFNVSATVNSLTLATPALQPTAGTLEFRLRGLNEVGIGGGAISPTAAVLFGNYTIDRTIEFFQVNGTISAVPEPSSLFFFCAVAPFIFAKLRTKRTVI